MLPGSPSRSDSAAQRERTQLAWRRTLLSLTLVIALVSRLAVITPTPTRFAMVALAMAGWPVIVVVVWRRNVALRAARADGPGRAATAIVLVVVTYAALGAGLMVTG